MLYSWHLDIACCLAADQTPAIRPTGLTGWTGPGLVASIEMSLVSTCCKSLGWTRRDPLVSMVTLSHKDNGARLRPTRLSSALIIVTHIIYAHLMRSLTPFYILSHHYQPELWNPKVLGLSQVQTECPHDAEMCQNPCETKMCPH